MFDRCLNILGTALTLALVAGPAMAGGNTISVPEPATITLFGVGIAGAFVARKFFGRK